MDGLTVSNANRFIEAGGTRGSLGLDQTQSTNSNSSAGAVDTQKSFADTLNEAIQQVNELQKTADVKAQELATGRTDDVAGVMLATEKADIALRTMVQVRNKIIDAYQEIMRMQV